VPWPLALALSRTPASVLPYLVSFGLLPLWLAAGIGLPLERVAAASVVVAPFAAAAHLANTLRDFDGDALAGSRNLAQVLGRRTSRVLALGMALGVGMLLALLFGLSGQWRPASLALGVIGLLAVGQGAASAPRLWYGMLVAAPVLDRGVGAGQRLKPLRWCRRTPSRRHSPR